MMLEENQRQFCCINWLIVNSATHLSIGLTSYPYQVKTEQIQSMFEYVLGFNNEGLIAAVIDRLTELGEWE